MGSIGLSNAPSISFSISDNSALSSLILISLVISSVLISGIFIFLC